MVRDPKPPRHISTRAYKLHKGKTNARTWATTEQEMTHQPKRVPLKRLHSPVSAAPAVRGQDAYERRATARDRSPVVAVTGIDDGTTAQPQPEALSGISVCCSDASVVL